MTTTSEQLAKWTEDFEEWFSTQLTIPTVPRQIQQAFALHGYLRAKQETEQFMKLAKFGAMVMDSKILMYHDSETITDAISCELLVDDAHHGDTVYGISYAPNIEATIKELLSK